MSCLKIVQNLFKIIRWLFWDPEEDNLWIVSFQMPAIHPICADLLDLEETKSALSQCPDIQLLVNNAGFTNLQPFLEVTEDAYDT